MHRLGFVEIETPVLQLVHGGANARPFNTHLNAFDTDMTLRIALELFLKRAVVGGVEQVYELGRIFRNEGIDSTHSAEFTMLEVYQSWGDQRTIAEVIKTIILDVADLLGSRVIDDPGRGDRSRRGVALARGLPGAVRGGRGGDHPGDLGGGPAEAGRAARVAIDPALGGAEARAGAVRRARRADADPADVRL